MAECPTSNIPDAREIASLSRWKRVAFAARCARSVQPLFVRYWPDAPANFVADIEAAIQVAESSAAAGRAPANTGAIAMAAIGAGRAARAVDNDRAAEVAEKASARGASRDQLDPSLHDHFVAAVRAEQVAKSAAMAAEAADSAQRAGIGHLNVVDGVAQYAARAADCAARTQGTTEARVAIRREFETLAQV